MSARLWVLVSLGIVLIGAAAVVVFVVLPRTNAQPKEPQGELGFSPREERAERRRPAFRVTSGPLPRELPMVGTEGKDADGYPTRQVDLAGMRTLLRFEKYKELTAYFEELQDAFEKDPRKEFWPMHAGEAFGSSEPEIDGHLDEWVKASPGSFAPYYARGSHFIGIMWASRGTKYARDTPAGDVRAMETAAARAGADLKKALEIRPRLVAAMRFQMQIAMISGDRPMMEERKRAALGVCPDCVQIHATYLHGLVPPWGSDRAAARALLGSLPKSNPRLAALGGFVAMGEAHVHAMKNDDARALAAIDRALTFGVYWEYLSERAAILERMGRTADALADLDRAHAERPMSSGVHCQRARVRRTNGDAVGAGNDLLLALRVDPTDADCKAQHGAILEAVTAKANELHAAKKRDEALDAAELALSLWPFYPQAREAHARIVVDDATTPERVAELERRAAGDPGNFRLVQQLDYALARDKQWDKIVAAWTAYIALHPDDARAYKERSGTYSHLRKGPEMKADLNRACDLGLNDACELAFSMTL